MEQLYSTIINYDREVKLEDVKAIPNCLDICNDYYFAKSLVDETKIPSVYWVGSLEEDVANLSEALKNYQKPSLIRLHLKDKEDSIRLLNMLYGVALTQNIPLLVYTSNLRYIKTILNMQKQP